jgi:DNA repair protein SbcD/Mre11
MKCVGVADLHLGYRAFPAVEAGGRNVRECDVERAWLEHVVPGIIATAPVLVTVAGDVFHHPRVGVRALRAWREGVRQIVLRTGAHVVVATGNHDVPRTADALTPVVLPDDYERVHVLQDVGRVPLDIGGQEVWVTVLPHARVGADEGGYDLRPVPGALNVLVIHGRVTTSAVPGVLPEFYAGPGALDVGALAADWDAIHCGDMHAFTRLHYDRCVFYSGAIEATTSDQWAEAGVPHGYTVYDPLTRRVVLVPVPGRRIVDVPWERGVVATADVVNGRLRGLLEEQLADAVVRLVVPSFAREERQAIDWALVRRLKQRCVHFDLDLRYVERAAVEVAPGAARPRAATLLEEAERFLAGDTEEVRALALERLADAMSVELTAPVAG